jgi:hypothetical protein
MTVNRKFRLCEDCAINDCLSCYESDCDCNLNDHRLPRELVRARANYCRALTRHHNEQARGLTDISVKQTRRMYHACQAVPRAYRKLQDLLATMVVQVQVV